jgi:hypothetical protein
LAHTCIAISTGNETWRVDLEVMTGHAISLELDRKLGIERRVGILAREWIDSDEDGAPTPCPPERGGRLLDLRMPLGHRRVVFGGDGALLRAERNRRESTDVLRRLEIHAANSRQWISNVIDAGHNARCHMRDRVSPDVPARAVADAIERSELRARHGTHAAHAVAKAQLRRCCPSRSRPTKSRAVALDPSRSRCTVQRSFAASLSRWI